MNKIEQIQEFYPDVPFIMPDGFDDAIVGVHRQANIVYSTEKVIEILIAQGMEHEDALDHFSYNMEDSYVGEYSPIYIDIL
jgi:hypothetical protein